MTLTPEEMRARIEAAKPDSQSYEGTAEYAAKVMLGVARRDAEAFGKALDAFRENPYGHEIDALMTEEERTELFKGQWGLTGFQWGWAVSQVAWLLEQKPVPNPALVQISPKDTKAT